MSATDKPDVLYAPFIWQETGVTHHDTLTGPVQVVFAHGAFLAKKTARDDITSKQLRRLAHNVPNCALPEFVRVYGAVTAQPSGAVRAVVTELCPLTLAEFIHHLPYRPGNEVVASMVLDIAHAVLYLHQHNMLHGDLVPRAVLVTSQGSCKVGDLGAPPAPNNAYTAPEVKAGAGLTPKADVFSFGVTVAELVTGLPPMEIKLADIIDEIEWEALRALVLRCVRPTPEGRPDMKEVVEDVKQLLASLDIPTPYNLLGFRTALCQKLKEAQKLLFFPDLYWAIEMGEECAAVARAEALPLQQLLDRRLCAVEEAVGEIRSTVSEADSRLGELESGIHSVSGIATQEAERADSPVDSDPLAPSAPSPPPAPAAPLSNGDLEAMAATVVATSPSSSLSSSSEGRHSTGGVAAPNAIDGSPAPPTNGLCLRPRPEDGSSGPPTPLWPRTDDPMAVPPTGRADLQSVDAASAPWVAAPGRDQPLQYVDDVDDEFCCSLCLEVMEDAACLTRCGHSFCHGCLRRALQRKAECPTCRQGGEACVPNFTLRKLIASLQVRCSNHACPVTVPRSDLPAHAQRCPHAPHYCNVPCSADPSERCAFVAATPEEREAHRQRCDFVRVHCPHGCAAQFSAKLLREHERTCPEMPATCEGCGASMTRHALAAHLCPNEEMECELCHELFPRHALPRHIETMATQHVTQLLQTLARQNRQLERLQDRVNEQAGELEEQGRRLAGLMTRVPSMQASVSSGGSLRVTWHAQVLKAHAMYESPVLQCHGYSFAARLSKPEGTQPAHSLSRTRFSTASNSGQEMYGLFLRSLNDVGVIVHWGVSCNGFRGNYNFFFQDKQSEAGTDSVIPCSDGQRLVIEMALRVSNVVLEGGEKKANPMEKYQDKRRRRVLLEPAPWAREDETPRDRPAQLPQPAPTVRSHP